MPTLLCLIVALAAAAPVETPAESCCQQAPQQASAASEPAASGGNLQSATRLRKLHLVRPDLIPYPLAYEVYC